MSYDLNVVIILSLFLVFFFGCPDNQGLAQPVTRLHAWLAER
jgi:hypothetical protein